MNFLRALKARLWKEGGFMPKKSAKKSGNVVVDLGEKIDGMISRSKLAGPSARPQFRMGARPGLASRHAFLLGSRPGMARSPFHRPTMGSGRGMIRRPMMGSGREMFRRPTMGAGWRPGYASTQWTLGAKLGIPEQLNTGQALGGTLIGTLGNRLLVRVVPGVVNLNSKLAVEAIAFGIGLIPFLAKRNSITTGVALPGVVFLAGSLADYAYDLVGVAKPVLSGAKVGAPAGDQAAAARQRLQALQSRIQRPAVRPATIAPARVGAQKAFA
jgi:hypothetical protein